MAQNAASSMSMTRLEFTEQDIAVNVVSFRQEMLKLGDHFQGFLQNDQVDFRQILSFDQIVRRGMTQYRLSMMPQP